jgi:hypothetical protein
MDNFNLKKYLAESKLNESSTSSGSSIESLDAERKKLDKQFTDLIDKNLKNDDNYLEILKALEEFTSVHYSLGWKKGIEWAKKANLNK